MDNDKLNIRENKLEQRLCDYEKAIITDALAKTKGNRTAAAELVGTTKRVLTYRVKQYGINCKQFKSR
jgi:DNA-binding NtrC family response regulator